MSNKLDTGSAADISSLADAIDKTVAESIEEVSSLSDNTSESIKKKEEVVIEGEETPLESELSDELKDEHGGLEWDVKPPGPVLDKDGNVIPHRVKYTRVITKQLDMSNPEDAQTFSDILSMAYRHAEHQLVLSDTTVFSEKHKAFIKLITYRRVLYKA